ncbi:hypothetical protein ACFXKJ_28645 [Kitasatospora indigofera]|uniref:hypothetical protein n=2 Tax=Kitasatospora indigofera TaxID=67307 RepID=UPI0036A05F3C
MHTDGGTMKKLGQITALFLAAASFIGFSSQSASAAGHASLQKTENFPVGGIECQTRDIILAEGNYHWTAQIAGTNGDERDIWLSKGTYKWNACLAHQAGSETYYKVSSYLQNYDLPSGATIGSYLMVVPNGSQTWGSILTPKFQTAVPTD